MHNNSDTPLISEFLTQLKTNLLCGEIKASDAALAAARLSRLFFTESHLAAMTRELLGYSDEQCQSELDVIKMIEESTEPHTHLRSLARHRVLRGYRMPLYVALRQTKDVSRPRVRREDYFCPLSACEIEELVNQAESAAAPYIVLDWSNSDSGVFICSTANIRAMHDGMKDLIVWSIDLLIKQLKMAAETDETEAAPTKAMTDEATAFKSERSI